MPRLAGKGATICRVCEFQFTVLSRHASPRFLNTTTVIVQLSFFISARFLDPPPPSSPPQLSIVNRRYSTTTTIIFCWLVSIALTPLHYQNVFSSQCCKLSLNFHHAPPLTPIIPHPPTPFTLPLTYHTHSHTSHYNRPLPSYPPLSCLCSVQAQLPPSQIVLPPIARRIERSFISVKH